MTTIALLFSRYSTSEHDSSMLLLGYEVVSPFLMWGFAAVRVGIDGGRLLSLKISGDDLL